MTSSRARHARTRTAPRHARPRRSRGAVGGAAVLLLAFGLQPTAAQAAPTQTTPTQTTPTLSRYELLFHFDAEQTLAKGSRVTDTSGQGHDGTVQTRYGGWLRPVPAVSGSEAARFPYVCAGLACPNAMVRVPDAPGLDPGSAPFTWGVRLRLAPRATTHGSNLLQKGLADDPGGQWKLQVDGLAGRPSCEVKGVRDGVLHHVAVTSPVSVATGRWTTVACRRTSRELMIFVAGVPVARKPMAPVWLSSRAPVTVGAKRVDWRDNDQFYGVLDDVYMRRD